ncbi:unnamed protein product, partial [Rhizoctonia solani]
AEELAESNHWTFAKNFNLHLFSESTRSLYGINLDRVSLLQIHTDYLRYLLRHTQAFFQDRVVLGAEIWERYKSTIEVVITHPNEWGTRKQTFPRNAVVGAGYADAKNASTGLNFMSKTEAFAYYGLFHSDLRHVVNGTTLLICDAGEEIVDITVFTLVSKYPALNIREKRQGACIRAGVALIDLELDRYLRQFLSGAGLSDEIVDEYTNAGVSDFKNAPKRMFSGEDQISRIRLGGSFTDSLIGVRRGILTLSGCVK